MRFVQHWQTARLISAELLNNKVTLLRFEPLETGVQPYPPGSHIQIAVEIGGRPDTRSYSLVGLSNARTYDIAVKRQTKSRGGSSYLSKLKPGATLSISAPHALFAAEDGCSEYLLVAGGIGVTPLIGFAEMLVSKSRKISFAYCAREQRDLVFGDRLQHLLGDALSVHLSSAGQRLDLKSAIATLGPSAMLLICAPLPMIEEARNLWHIAGRDPSLIRFETFGTAGNQPTQAFDVRLGRSGQSIRVAESSTILEALAEADIVAMADCKRGECGVCAVDLLEVDGSVDHRDVFLSTEQKQQNGKICLCVSRASGTITIDTQYRMNL